MESFCSIFLSLFVLDFQNKELLLHKFVALAMISGLVFGLFLIVLIRQSVYVFTNIVPMSLATHIMLFLHLDVLFYIAMFKDF